MNFIKHFILSVILFNFLFSLGGIGVSGLIVSENIDYTEIGAPLELSYTNDGILITPIINNRKVETFIRIENNNPFIIGGLISDKKYDSVGGIPFLSKIPLIGKL